MCSEGADADGADVDDVILYANSKLMISQKCECVPANQVYLYIGEAKHVLCWNVGYIV